MAFARLLRNLMRDEQIGKFVVPIIPDEGRTFGLDALFAEMKIYSPRGQLYTSVDAGLPMHYAEAVDGQILEEGITEAGGMASFMAAGTSYATWSQPMLPVYMYYSMFGFQRVGDQIWQLADERARGFLVGCTAGRTTMNGEGLQHEDGQSHVLASTLPNVRAYDPSFAYEVAAIVQDGIRVMCGPQAEDVFYYLTVYNENYTMPALPEGEEGEAVIEGTLRGLYRYAEPAAVQSLALPGGDDSPPRRATILFSGTAWQAAERARGLLATDWNVSAETWSATSYKSLREDALEVERWNRLHPAETPRVPYVTRALATASGPIVAVTDFMKAVPDQIARFVNAPFTPLGTDGFGRSDTRETLRRHFEVDAEHIVVAVLSSLASNGAGKHDEVSLAISAYGIDPEAPDPRVA
jgi:pyruvate dehydrogenase E1 component